MSLLDIFDGDAFSTRTMTEAIDALPYKPMRLEEYFTTKGVRETKVMIEHREGRIRVLPTAPRGGTATTSERRTRTVRAFVIPHIPYEDSILASDLQNVRAFGSESQLEAFSQVVNEQLADMKDDVLVTHDWHRAGAIVGKVYDADGSTLLLDMFSEFGISETNINIDLATDDMKLKGHAIKRAMEDALGADSYSGIKIFCSNTFFDALVVNPSVKEAYDRYQESSMFRADDRFTGLEFPRGIFWENYRGKTGTLDFVADDVARCIPLGASKIFDQIFGPADFIETVNTTGKPMYAKQHRMKFDRGVEVHVETNPLMICNRPSVLIKLTSV